MNLPNLKEAKIRTNKEVAIKEALNLKSDKFKGQKFYLKTYGCQMNVHDSEEIKGILTNLSFSETTDLNEADIIVLNTCAIRENAHDKVFGFLGRVKHSFDRCLQLRLLNLQNNFQRLCIVRVHFGRQNCQVQA